MATNVPLNTCTAVEVGVTLTELSLFSTWLLVWSSEGESVFLVTGDYTEGEPLPAANRPIPPTTLPFPIDVSPYGGQLFIAASGPCVVVLEGRE